MNHNLLIFLTSLIFTFPVFAQTRGITFSRFSEQDGLPNSAVNAITQDENGFIWIGTEEGLSRFDGYTFKNYFRDLKNPNSLSDNEIISICADTGGVLWIGTYTRGLNRFNIKTEEFTRFLSWTDKKNNLSSNFIKNIFIDKNRNIWVGTDNGLNKIIFKPDSLGQGEVQVSIFKHDKHNEKSIAGNIITDIIQDNNGDIWIGTTNGLSKSEYVNDSELEFIPYPKVPIQIVPCGSISRQLIAFELRPYLFCFW